MPTRLHRPLALAILLVPSALAAACDLGGGSSHHADTHTSRPDATSADTRVDDVGGDAVDPDAWVPPGVVEFRGRPGPWLRTFYVAPDGASLLVPIEAEGSTPVTRQVVIARVDATTLAVTPGPVITAVGRSIELFTSADPEVVWAIDYEAGWLAPLAIDTLELGDKLVLPETAYLRNATWAIDGKGVSFAYRASPPVDDAPWTGVFALDLPEDALALEATTELRSVTIAASDYLRMRFTSGGVLAMSGAPKKPRDPGCFFLCFDEPDLSRAFFHVYQLRADEDPRDPRIAETTYDDSFRVAPTGRWLFRQDSEGHVNAIELGETIGTPRATPCRGVGLMELAPDGRVICPGPSTFKPGEPSVFHLDADLATLDEVDVPASLIVDLVTSADFRRVWVQGAMVDLTVDPAKVIVVASDFTSAVPGPDDVWVYSSSAGAFVRRVAWDDGTVVTTSIPTGDIVQLEPLGDGVAIVRSAALDRITIHDATGAVRGTIARRLAR